MKSTWSSKEMRGTEGDLGRKKKSMIFNKNSWLEYIRFLNNNKFGQKVIEYVLLKH